MPDRITLWDWLRSNLRDNTAPTPRPTRTSSDHTGWWHPGPDHGQPGRGTHH